MEVIVKCICDYDLSSNERDHNSDCPVHNVKQEQDTTKYPASTQSTPVDDVVERMCHVYNYGDRSEDQSKAMAPALAVAREGWVPTEKFESMRRINDENLECYNNCAKECADLKQQLALEQVENTELRAELALWAMTKHSRS